MDFKTRLKYLREKKGFTQAQLANELNIFSSDTLNLYTQHISYWENGREPSYNILITLSKYFNVSVDYLIGLDETYTSVNNFLSNDEIIQLNKNFKPEFTNFLIDNFELIKQSIMLHINSPATDAELIEHLFTTLNILLGIFDILELRKQNVLDLLPQYVEDLLTATTNDDTYVRVITKLISKTAKQLEDPIQKLNNELRIIQSEYVLHILGQIPLSKNKETD